MDLNALLPTAQELQILMPDGTKTDFYVTLIGLDSAEARAVVMKLGQKQQVKGISVKEAFDGQVELAAACVLGWRGLTDNGVEVQFSKAKALEILGDERRAFVREQIERFIGERANFFPRNTETTD